jgi:predicted permease
VAVIQGFMPTAVSSVLIANLFGLNTRMASALFVVNTVIFLVLVLPILAFVLF